MSRVKVAPEGVYDRMCDRKLLRKAIENAARHKRGKECVKRILDHIDHYVNELYRMLKEESYKPSKFREEVIHCPEKDRLIKKLPFFPDRCVHHAIALVMLPYWNNAIMDCTFASWKGRGINSRKKQYDICFILRRYIARMHKYDTVYCLKMDIHKCYQSVDNDILDEVMKLYCKDGKMLKLLFIIIHSDTGLPIGSYISQLLINLYLTQVDCFVLNTLGLPKYVRYMDDMAILSTDKPGLQQAKHRIGNFLWYVLHLELNGKTQVFPIGGDKYHRSLDICGYKFYREHTQLRNRIKRNMKMKKSANIEDGISSYKGMLMNCESTNLRNTIGL